jgi:hypothetical protein
MTTVEIVQTFTGFPDGTEASRTLYVAGERHDLADDFAKLIVGKRHARKIVDRPPAGQFLKRPNSEGDAA